MTGKACFTFKARSQCLRAPCLRWTLPGSQVFRAGLPREKMLEIRGSLAAIRRAGVQIGAQVRQRIEPVLGGREEDGIRALSQVAAGIRSAPVEIFPSHDAGPQQALCRIIIQRHLEMIQKDH